MPFHDTARQHRQPCPMHLLLSVLEVLSSDSRCHGAHAGHKNAVLELHWTTDGEKLLSASPDKSLRAWDAQTGLQIKKMAEHDSFVNSCSPLRRGPPLLVSGSDDCSAKASPVSCLAAGSLQGALALCSHACIASLLSSWHVYCLHGSISTGQHAVFGHLTWLQVTAACT